MGIITEISQQKNKKRINIFVDGEFKSGLGVETAIKFGLKTGKHINDEELEQIILDSESRSAFDTALNFLSLTPKSKFEVKQKLIKKGFLPIVIDHTIKKLEEYHYVDDEAYARMYVESVSKKSKNELQRKLWQKGIEKCIIDSVIDGVDDSCEENNAIEYARKYLRNKESSDKNLKNLLAGLMRKGYSYELSYKVMQMFRVGEGLWLVLILSR